MTGYPVVDSVTPPNGPAAGGTPVTLSGRNFTGTTSLHFMETGAPPGVSVSFTVVDDATITTVTPPGTEGEARNLVLVNAAGTSDGDIILADSSGSAFNGTYGSGLLGPSGWDSGLVAGGDSLRAYSTSVVDAATASGAGGFLNPNTAVSVEWWYSTTNGRGVKLIIDEGGGGQNITFWAPEYFSGSGGHVACQVSDGTGGAQFTAPDFPAPTDGAAHHVVLTYSPSGPTLDVYIDGAFVEAIAPVGAAPTFTQPLDSLRLQTGPIGVPPGADVPVYVDEVAIYPAALSAGDVSANFSAAGISDAAYRAQVLSLAPSAFYRFDDERRNGFFGYNVEDIPFGGWYLGVIAMAESFIPT